MSGGTSMTMAEIAVVIEAKAVLPNDTATIQGVYCSDMLSDVLGNAEEDYLWITVQNHRNIVAVAETRDLPVILIAAGRPVLDDTQEQARNLGVAIYSTPLTVYEAAGRLYEAGLGRSQS